MEFPLTIEIAESPVATKTYRTLVGRRSVTENLYIIDEPDRFIGYRIRRVEGKAEEYLEQAVVERLRKGTDRYRAVLEWAQATSEPGEEIPDTDFMIMTGLGKNTPLLIVGDFSQERFDKVVQGMRGYFSLIKEEF